MNTGGGDSALDRIDAIPSHPSARGKQPDVLLVVFTDGENDVAHPGDDAGLLAGNDGLEQVLQKARRKASQLPLTIITVGLEGRRTFNQEALRRLAFPADANTYYRAQNRSDLQRAFGSITIEKALDQVPGVTSKQINTQVGTVTVTFDDERTSLPVVTRAITDAGFPASVREKGG